MKCLSSSIKLSILFFSLPTPNVENFGKRILLELRRMLIEKEYHFPRGTLTNQAAWIKNTGAEVQERSYGTWILITNYELLLNELRPRAPRLVSARCEFILIDVQILWNRTDFRFHQFDPSEERERAWTSLNRCQGKNDEQRGQTSLISCCYCAEQRQRAWTPFSPR